MAAGSNDIPRTKADWHLWIDLGMLVVTTLGFAATVYTIRDSAKTFVGTTYANASPLITGMDQVFINNPGLRAYLYGDANGPVPAPAPKDPEYQKVMAMSEFAIDTYDSFLAQRIRYGAVDIDPDWTDWMKSTFASSPSLVYFMEEHQAWYRSGELFKIYDQWRGANQVVVAKAMKCVPIWSPSEDLAPVKSVRDETACPLSRIAISDYGVIASCLISLFALAFAIKACAFARSGKGGRIVHE